MVIKKILTLVAVLALALFMVPTNSFAEDGADNIVLAAANTAKYVEINGHKVRLANENDTYSINSDGSTKFGRFISSMSRARGVSVDELISLQGWDEDLLDEKMPNGKLWVHPSLRPSSS